MSAKSVCRHACEATSALLKHHAQFQCVRLGVGEPPQFVDGTHFARRVRALPRGPAFGNTVFWEPGAQTEQDGAKRPETDAPPAIAAGGGFW